MTVAKQLAFLPEARAGNVETGFMVLVALTVVVLAVLTLTDAIPISNGELIVISIRLLAPLIIFRYWLAGGIIAMLLDAADVILIDLIGLGGFGGNYAETDKVLDSYYYVIEIIVALQWANRWMSIPAILLFIFRVIGAIAFEITHAHIMLFIFPNLFENWWLYCVVVIKWFPHLVPKNLKMVLIPLFFLLIPKMGQEYLLHYAEAHPWDWTKNHILDPIGLKP